ncbi:MAG: FecR domain-containing protein [Myxococcaceae bacterium]|nr:FecR domain-containing protein [Myxococcaceae bacterium]
MRAAAFVLAVFSSQVWAAENRCNGVKLEAGQVRTGKPLSEEWVRSADGKGCLGEIVQAVDKNRLVRAVTVAALVPDAERASGKGLQSAKAVAAALVEAGLPKSRVFGLAPAPKETDVMGISLRYVERAPEDVVARVAATTGPVFLGPDEASLKPAEPGMPVLVNELVKTGPGAKVTIHLKDGSGIEVKPESAVRLPVLEADGATRQVKIEVLRGGIVADVRKASQLSKFEASSRVSVASVRGTQFRLGVEEAGETRVETLEGLVAVGSALEPKVPPVEVPAGQGTKVGAEGRVAAPRPIPQEPRVTSPLKGPLGAEQRFEWSAVPDVVAYDVELARDADFIVEAKVERVPATATTLSWPAVLAKGRWFWRVTGVDSAGFTGSPSKVYAFTVGK